jgi:hypothetical protein
VLFCSRFVSNARCPCSSRITTHENFYIPIDMLRRDMREWSRFCDSRSATPMRDHECDGRLPFSLGSGRPRLDQRSCVTGAAVSWDREKVVQVSMPRLVITRGHDRCADRHDKRADRVVLASHGSGSAVDQSADVAATAAPSSPQFTLCGNQCQ